MWQFIEVFKRVALAQSSKRIQDDDVSDRLSHTYTVSLLILFTILVGSSQFVGSPIACWAPAQFTGSMVQYANYVCWIANTYFVPTDETLPNPMQTREHRINYYQWVPFILALMAFMFYFPYAIWHIMAKPSGLDAKNVMRVISSMDPSSTESRDKCIRSACKLIDRALDYHQGGTAYYDHNWAGVIRRKVSRCCLPQMRGGSYLTFLYVLIKLLYVINVCGQFFLLNAFMGPHFNIYGFQVISQLFRGQDFWESPRFPRITMCDFTIRTLGENNQRNTIQCTLPINLFNEKIFIFIWFWMVLVAFMSVYSLLLWLVTFTNPSRIEFVKRYLRINGFLYGTGTTYNHLSSSTSSSTTIDAKIFDAFVYEYLRLDGVFLLRIIKKNTNDIVVGELVCALYDEFKRSARFAVANHGNDSMPKQDLNNVNGEALIPNGYHHA